MASILRLGSCGYVYLVWVSHFKGICPLSKKAIEHLNKNVFIESLGLS